MKKVLLSIVLLIIGLSLSAQVKTKKQMEDDFEKYKKEQARDFDNFKQRREEELRRMQKEYQDYYDSMLGLKKYYTKVKDTVKVNVVNEIIKFETNVSNALGNKLLTAKKVDIQSYSVTQPAKKANCDAAYNRPTNRKK